MRLDLPWQRPSLNVLGDGSPFIRVTLSAELGAHIHKLQEDDPEGLERAVEDRMVLEENQDKSEDEIRVELDWQRQDESIPRQTH